MRTFEQLFPEAQHAQELSYSPYSHFRVGAVIECKDGTLIYGANIENAAYSVTVCAERTAIFQAYLRGYRKNDFAQLCLVADSEEITTPCGACRQVLSELFDPDAPIYCCGSTGKYIKTSVKELLPFGFSEENLKK